MNLCQAFVRGGFIALIGGLMLHGAVFAAPTTINVQGNLEQDGAPLTGERAYRVRIYDASTAGTQLGGDLTGMVTVSDGGRFSIELEPPEEMLSAPGEIYYELAIDSAIVPDGAIDPEDAFPDQVEVHSVPFARTADHATSADTAKLAETAMALSGMLSNPGDRIPLGDDVFLQVGVDGMVELLVGGARLRLARQKWFDPRNLLDNISATWGGRTPSPGGAERGRRRGDRLVSIRRRERSNLPQRIPRRLVERSLQSLGQHQPERTGRI